MPNTPKGITYPSSSSPVAVPADIQELATDVDGLIVPNTGGTYTGSVSFTQPPSVPTPTSGLHAVNKTYADAINADVTALETELGANPSGTFSTVVQRLDSYTSGFDQIGNVLSTASASCSGDWTINNVIPSYNTPTGSVTLAAGWSYALPNVKIVGSANFRSPIALPNELWTAQVEISSTGGSTYVSLFFADASGSTLSQLIGNHIVAGTSGLSRAVGVAPSGTVEVVLAVYNTNGSTAAVLSQPTLHRGVGGLFAMPGKIISGQSNVLTNNAIHLSGTGSPESVISAAPGSTFLQTDSVVDVKGWIRWIKATGTGSTGWVAGPEADTGWRQIVSWAGGVQDGTNQVGTIDTTQYSLSGTGGIWIRRIGQYVEWWLHGAITKTNSGSHKLFTVYNSIPSGFRADGQATYGVSVPLSHTVDFLGTYGIGDTPSFDSTAGGFNLAWHSCRHYTSNSWPTSLPGTAA